MLRLDVGGSFHRNPDAEIECLPEDPFRDIHGSCIGRYFEIGEPHIHYYREGFGDSWAYPVDGLFSDIGDVHNTFEEYL